MKCDELRYSNFYTLQIENESLIKYLDVGAKSITVQNSIIDKLLVKKIGNGIEIESSTIKELQFGSVQAKNNPIDKGIVIKDSVIVDLHAKQIPKNVTIESTEIDNLNLTMDGSKLDIKFSSIDNLVALMYHSNEIGQIYNSSISTVEMGLDGKGFSISQGSEIIVENSEIDSLNDNCIIVYGTLELLNVDINDIKPHSIVLREDGSELKFYNLKFYYIDDAISAHVECINDFLYPFKVILEVDYPWEIYIYVFLGSTPLGFIISCIIHYKCPPYKLCHKKTS